ncbi:hypothetical protein [Lelliottia wanjuensis]|uniref:Uncharacterized protein n=1 Tax=Lelliottia wanjuensis TaxID=3050585 RepID=A0AAP4D2B0_9ENTR|nr:MULTISPECIES: hypothetical protein [unclassified Lelliottia]MDK9362939.1 hypothetical protein [Lelliottia sp. V106_12]MDK9616576.1 hypothetical protein [Lelliottia sp. V106_9]
MSFQTDERIKSYLDTNQLHREQMCRAILAIDKRYTDVRPRHPRGGRDGGRDLEAVYREEQTAYGAVGFVNQANDSNEQKKSIRAKFISDLKSALSSNKELDAFVFFTNINMTIRDKESLIDAARTMNISHCEIFDRERIRISLDCPDGFSIRFQYLNIPLSEAEQASFFSQWGDDIQKVISSGFKNIDNGIRRLLFLEESKSPLHHFTISFELNAKYFAESIGHFRAFCLMNLKEVKNNLFGIAFGSSDKSNRMRGDVNEDCKSEPLGIKNGVSAGQWEHHIDLDKIVSTDGNDEKYKLVGSSSSIGVNEVEFIRISYRKDRIVRYKSTISLRDLDEAMYLPLMNKSLAEKIKAIHIYADGYKIQEFGFDDFSIDPSSFEPSIPVKFSDEELSDPWVRIRPSNFSSAFHIRFSEKTPRRMFMPEQVENKLDI